MGKFLKRNKASNSIAATQAESKKASNGIVKRRVRQDKNGLEMNIDLDFESMDDLVTQITCKCTR